MADHSTDATPVRRPGGRTARLRERMLAAATELVAQHGIGGLRYEEVAEVAGVNKTSVYRNWPDKVQLVTDALSSFAADTLSVNDSGDLRADLVDFLMALADSLATPQGRALLAVVTSAWENTEMHEILQTVQTRRGESLRLRVGNAIERGELPPVDVQFLTEMMSGPVHLAHRRSRQPFTRKDAEQVIDVVLAGVRAVYGG
ncbi:TetR family transcriptional regulator [Actinosynnema sp. ALI-1.44]|uniref:TetR/AcrR family transcriptional regulator n=1 Tax=Actinosynnema sp. ALI-1.44 TaxID=1933779 RepID=UPI00097C8277|nr:TetR/AcrR family transcriptional regulator [Actinosynnema sp. ALI-1.44]ONI89627.1 TetR family transcriptional regulator [Actinosynnema sp. ALI-1.44]